MTISSKLNLLSEAKNYTSRYNKARSAVDKKVKELIKNLDIHKKQQQEMPDTVLFVESIEEILRQITAISNNIRNRVIPG